MVTCACAFIIPSFILCFIMANQGFNNPDVEDTGLDCYARHSDNIGYPFAPGKNVTSEFVTWFKFGFVLNLLYIVYGLMIIIAISPSCELLGACSGLFNCLVSCGGIAWYITGIIFRWRHFGKVCSGEYWDRSSVEPNVYMVKTGATMANYYYITWVVFGITLLGWCGCCVFQSLASSR